MGEALLVRKGGGVKVTVDGTEVSKGMDLVSKVTSIRLKDLTNTSLNEYYPRGAAMSDGIHLLISGQHLVINDDECVSAPSGPSTGKVSGAVVALKNVLYRTYTTNTAYGAYKFSDGTWTNLGITCPCLLEASDQNYAYGITVSRDTAAMYKYDGNTLTKIKDITDGFSSNLLLCDDGNFYFIDGGKNIKRMYKMKIEDTTASMVYNFQTSSINSLFNAVGNDIYMDGNYKLENQAFVETQFDGVNQTSANSSACIIVQNGEMHAFHNTKQHRIINAKLYREVPQ